MDKKYLQLLTEIVKTTAILSEKVMDYDHKKNDQKGMETAQLMRDD